MTAPPRRLDLHSIRAAAVAAVLAGALAGCAPGGDDELQAQLDAVFTDYSSADGPGCSLGVIRDGRLIHATGYGAANLDYGIPNRPATIYRIASVSKQFTAGAVALLALRGEVDLDAPVQRYVPEFPDYPDPPTVRHLIHHTSGVRDYLGVFSLAGSRSEDFITNPDILDAIHRQRELNFPPGAEYLYSNSGYVLLAEIVARVSGQSLREFAQAEFFDPLGMPRTHFHDDHNEVVSDRATGYSPTDDGFRIDMTTLDVVGDGGIYTSVEEWPAWDRNLTEGTVGGPEWVALMHERGVLTSGDTIPYAFGLSHGEHRGVATVGHSGSWVGYRTGMSRYPDAGYSFVALCNRSRIDPMALIRSTAEIYLEDVMDPPEEVADVAEAAEAETAEEAPAEDDASDAQPDRDIPNRSRYAGSFYSPELDATYRIEEEGSAGLTLRVGRRDPVALAAEADGQLTTEDGPTFRFSELAGGRYEAMTVDAGRVRNLRFARTEG
ncbi:serine hydrolase domain-containing protein [Candidatus Palauibacter polyketidifaciens]|uniref:serine hydrolase domain-containing protein n=1 Tax=Candidatus Palauibacter polyketidifaciens TaxID=3056740 RepID=UPI002395A4C5|nr:serine hydrolase domain-containing protein [Candidatus Palauibacter polyketidifaciens]MDE2720498.1 serine hydrolase [Candidatus Palauibacter polyketidifaciens]